MIYRTRFAFAAFAVIFHAIHCKSICYKFFRLEFSHKRTRRGTALYQNWQLPEFKMGYKSTADLYRGRRVGYLVMLLD